MESNLGKIIHHLDRPDFGAPVPRCLIVRGWCFFPDGRPVAGIRLRAGSFFLAGATGLHRPDVKAAFPSAPNDNTGFEIRGVLPPAITEITIEARSEDRHWHSFLNRKIETRRHVLPRWIGKHSVSDLMFFQAPGFMQHVPRRITPERFPLSNRFDRHHPRLSIVTPSFEQGCYLSDTIQSVVASPDCISEYVIQDGASQDGSVDIIRSFAGDSPPSPDIHSRSTAASREKLSWESIRDEGQTHALARAFAKTSGTPADLMAWINSDDFYMPGALAFVVDYFARHPDVDVIYGHRVLVDENSQEIGRWYLPPHDSEVLRLNDFVPQETLFWRRRIWEQVGGLDKRFRFAMDWDLLLRFQDAGACIVRVPYFLGCFRIHAAQKTSASMHDMGQAEITRLRERTFGRPFSPEELEQNQRLRHYLRKSSWIEFLWKMGIRAR